MMTALSDEINVDWVKWSDIVDEGKRASTVPDKRKRSSFPAVEKFSDEDDPSGGHGRSNSRKSSASDLDGDSDGVSGGKKGKTSERRRQQNRQAQRAFRERKERHVKELEDRVYALEQQSIKQTTENNALKQLLERFKSENDDLKAATRTVWSPSMDTDSFADFSVRPGGVRFDGAALRDVNFKVDETLAAVSGKQTKRSPASGSGSNASPAVAPSPSAASLLSLNNTPASLNSSSASDVRERSQPGSGNPTPSSASSGNPATPSLYGPSPSAPSPFGFMNNTTQSSEMLMSALFSNYRDPSDLDALFGQTGDDIVPQLSPGALNLFASAYQADANDALSSLTATGADADVAQIIGPAWARPSPQPNQRSGAQSVGSDAALSSGSVPSGSDGASSSTTETSPSSAASSCATPPKSKDPLASDSITSELGLVTNLQKSTYEFDLDSLCADMASKATCQEAARKALHEVMLRDESG